MFFLGTQIQQDEHGRCTLLPSTPRLFTPPNCKLPLNASLRARVPFICSRHSLPVRRRAHRGLAQDPRESVAYVRSLLGNRGRFPGDDRNSLRLHRHSVWRTGRFVQFVSRWSRYVESGGRIYVVRLSSGSVRASHV